MNKKQTVCYWSPFIKNVATVKAVFNSALSLKKYSYGKYNPIILDVFGEWKSCNFQDLEKITFYKLNNLKFLSNFSSDGFVRSRLKYLIIFTLSFFSLKKFIINSKPDFLIIHLITSLPLFLNLIYKFDTKIVLRISGKPKMNLLRYFFWKIALKKVSKITFPTLESLNYFQSLNVIDKKKTTLLYDPVFEIRKIVTKKNEILNLKNIKKNEYFLSIGRLTKQKNFLFLARCFERIIKNHPELKLVIIGEGEDKKKIEDFIINKNLSKNIFLLGYKNNIFNYLYNSKAFILSSLWEDPGFVIIEAIVSETFVLSSDCPNGPKEIIGNNNGILFKSNSEEDFINKFNKFLTIDEFDKIKVKIAAKKIAKKFSIFSHYISLNKNLESLND